MFELRFDLCYVLFGFATNTHKFLLLSGWLNFRLTGRHVDSVGAQVGYLPFDFKRLAWARSWDWKWQALALAPEFAGDRVAAFIHATADMIITAHGGKTEFFLLDGMDAQHLYNAARNVETAVWLLAQRRNARGGPLLLADEINAQERNLSYEREFGKIIARLDLLAQVTTEKYRRAVIGYVQGLAGGTFLQFLPVR